MRTTTMLLAIGCVGAQSRLARWCAPRRSIITRGRRTTPTITYHRTTATVTDGLGMTARAVGRCRAETVPPTEVRLAERGVPGTVARAVTQSKRESANRIEDISSQSLRQTVAAPIFFNPKLRCGRRGSRLHHAYKPFRTTNASGWFFRRGGFGENHDKISTDRSSGGLVGGRNDDSHRSKWPTHWGISTSAVEPKSLCPLRLPSSLLRLLS